MIKKQRFKAIGYDFNKNTIFKDSSRGFLTFRANFYQKRVLLFKILKGFNRKKWKKGVFKNHHKKRFHRDMSLFFRPKRLIKKYQKSALQAILRENRN